MSLLGRFFAFIAASDGETRHVHGTGYVRQVEGCAKVAKYRITYCVGSGYGLHTVRPGEKRTWFRM